MIYQKNNCDGKSLIVYLVLSLIRIPVALIDTIGSGVLITQYMLKMFLMNAYNFASAICQIVSFLPMCCVFLVTSKTNCFGMGKGICQRTNSDVLYLILFIIIMVWILFFGGLETSLRFIGYSGRLNKTSAINNNTNLNLKETNNSLKDSDTKGTNLTNQTFLRAIKLVRSKTNKPKIVYFHALPPEIAKQESLFQGFKKTFQKFKRKVSGPLTATPVPVDEVNPLAFKYSPIALQSMPDVLQTPEKNETFIHDF